MFPVARPETYDPDLMYDEEAGTWTAPLTSGGRYSSQMVLVGSDDDGLGCIYISELEKFDSGDLIDYYNEGYNDAFEAEYYDGTGTWLAQTFKASTNYTIKSVRLRLYRDYNPGIITVVIMNTIDGIPGNADLCSGTTNGDTLTEDGEGEFREITFGTGTSLTQDEIYAIVIRIETEDAYLGWLIETADPSGYTNGDFYISGDDGTNWELGTPAEYGSSDAMFKCYGEI